MSIPPSRRLADLGVVLPPPPAPVGSYAPVHVAGPLAFVSGQIAATAGAVDSPGLVGSEVTVEIATALARKATLQGLSALAAATGSLDRVARIVRVGVFVASAPGFDRAHEVANGATDLLRQLFEAQPAPARVAVGVARLPKNAPVEVELLAALA